ncbi:MAG: hypothetical protein EGR26_01680 [Clostridiales bacterium]|nr:hypothetical protein [Clostridiales bacterium]
MGTTIRISSRSFSEGRSRSPPHKDCDRGLPRDNISLTKHGLKIPVDAADYAGFVLRMSICEQECKRELTG